MQRQRAKAITIQEPRQGFGSALEILIDHVRVPFKRRLANRQFHAWRESPDSTKCGARLFDGLRAGGIVRQIELHRALGLRERAQRVLDCRDSLIG